jgi:hypothetical protein
MKMVQGLSRQLVMLVFILMISVLALYGQDPHTFFYKESLGINNGGMMVLGAWAIGNIAVGAYGWSQNTGERQYFHQMNLFWNVVNLSIAGFAIYGNLTADYLNFSHDEILSKQLKSQNLFLINAGLDVVYMGTGVVLRNIAHRYPNNESRWKGYGGSVILQGGFLFVFDLVMYGLQRSHRLDFLDQISVASMPDALGLSFSLYL